MDWAHRPPSPSQSRMRRTHPSKFLPLAPPYTRNAPPLSTPYQIFPPPPPLQIHIPSSTQQLQHAPQPPSHHCNTSAHTPSPRPPPSLSNNPAEPPPNYHLRHTKPGTLSSVVPVTKSLTPLPSPPPTPPPTPSSTSSFPTTPTAPAQAVADDTLFLNNNNNSTASVARVCPHRWGWSGAAG